MARNSPQIDAGTRRKLRMSLGSRTARRQGTKSRRKMLSSAGTGSTFVKPARARAKLSALIVKHLAEQASV